MQVSVVITVLNEANSVRSLCTSLAAQTKLPKEVIIVDGGSSDKTVEILTQCQQDFPQLTLRIITQKGNRSVGRNTGISQANSEWIAITDAGCEPTRRWLEQLCATQQTTQAEVVAGYYRGGGQTSLEKAIVPYVLVMPDQVNAATFLPATRSMLIKKSIWRKLKGFDERLSHNEDYAFARKLLSTKQRIVFSKNAVVLWHPRNSLQSFAVMIYRFALGDAEARCYRPKVWLVFSRYILAVIWIILIILLPSKPVVLGWLITVLFISGYILWAIQKNFRYATKSWYWLPILQLIADGAVMLGTLRGLLQQKK